MRVVFPFFLSFITFLSLRVSAQPGLPPLTDSIDSKILQEARGIQVIMPKDYQPESGKRYEIVYILDGEWYYELVPYTFNFAQSAEYTPKHIFVLIRNKYNNGRNMRDRDFSPTRLSGDTITGGADRFYDFVKTEVVPYIEKKYPGNGQRTLVGSSFSGLFCVYAFVKDPGFFHSFVASDPNINWDNSYVTSKMTERLKNLPETSGTLFVAGLTVSYSGMGIAGLDSVLRSFAPKSLHWKCVPYEQESHYSVQLKAFYDGARFSHKGFATRPPEFHPMKGTFTNDTGFPVFFMNLSPLVRYTIDGSEPDSTSPLMVRGQSVNVKTPGVLKIQSFGNRPIYTNTWVANYEQGTIKPRQRNKGGDRLTYAVYRAGWDSLGMLSRLKPEKSGSADSTFRLSRIEVPNSLTVLEGSLNIPEDGTYIFYSNGYKAVQLELDGKTLFNTDSAEVYPSQSYIASLMKGTYSVRLAHAKHADREPHFLIFKTKPPYTKWWENEWKNW